MTDIHKLLKRAKIAAIEELLTQIKSDVGCAADRLGAITALTELSETIVPVRNVIGIHAIGETWIDDPEEEE